MMNLYPMGRAWQKRVFYTNSTTDEIHVQQRQCNLLSFLIVCLSVVDGKNILLVNKKHKTCF